MTAPDDPEPEQPDDSSPPSQSSGCGVGVGLVFGLCGMAAMGMRKAVVDESGGDYTFVALGIMGCMVLWIVFTYLEYYYKSRK